MTRRLVLLALLVLGGCNLDLGSGPARSDNGTVSGVSVTDFDGGIGQIPRRPGSGGGTGGSDPCFVPCNGGYGSNCGWVCGGSGPSF